MDHLESVRYCREHGIEDLDEMVRELKMSEARDINSEGLDAQIDYVLRYVGGEELRKRLAEITRPVFHRGQHEDTNGSNP